MRKLIVSAITLIAVVGISGCGGNNTYSPNFQGGGGGGSFTLTRSPSTSDNHQGDSTNYTITATSTGGFSSPVALSVSDLPAGTTGTFNPASVTPTAGGANSTLTVTTTGPGSGGVNGTIRSAKTRAVTPTGTYTLTITGTGGGVTQTTTVRLVVEANTTPSFTMQGGDTENKQQGQVGSFDVTVTSVNGFAGTITFSMPNVPPGSTVQFSPPSITLSSVNTSNTTTVYIQTSLNTPPRTYTPIVVGASGTLTNQATETLTITPGGP